jgi:glycosyltransferase involved in cell wall biosynthesis
MTSRWDLVTGEFPPHAGGVSDYCALLADGLAVDGTPVHVWAPAAAGPDRRGTSVVVHRLRGGFGLGSLAWQGGRVARAPGSRTLLLQYVPQAFGYRGLNLPFCLWLARRRQPVWTMFHEVLVPQRAGQPARERVLAAVTRVMAAVLARASERIFVSIPAWATIVRSLVPSAAPAEWIPIPTTIPCVSRGDARDVRRRLGAARGPLVGHFGSAGPLIARQLELAMSSLLGRRADATAVLVGRGAEDVVARIVRRAPALAARVRATGPLSAEDVSAHLRACDLMIQPFADGVTTRRTSVMAALAHGVPTVTTTGPLTEPLWAESGAVALARADDATGMAMIAASLLDSPDDRERLGSAARETYDRYFDLRHTIAALQRTDRANGRLAPAGGIESR